MSSAWEPTAMMEPPSITTMRSASSTEAVRWAMIIFVVSGMNSRSARRMPASVLVSTAEVESSSMSIFGFLSSARAMHRRCFWPPETLVPPCSM